MILAAGQIEVLAGFVHERRNKLMGGRIDVHMDEGLQEKMNNDSQCVYSAFHAPGIVARALYL